MKCLTCNAEMTNNLVITKDGQLSYDVCEGCGSLWLDHGQLKKLAFQVEGDIEYCSTKDAEGVREPARNCPRCDNTSLHKVFFIGYSDIVLDYCHNCTGFWLDGGELDAINKELQRIMPVKAKGFSDFLQNVHIPYWHKRIKRKSSEVDFAIDAPPLKHAELQGETDRGCPACDAKLNSYTAYGISIEGCPKCKGIWLDKDELRRLKDKTDTELWSNLRWMDDEIEALEKARAMPSRRLCPKCDGVKLISAGFGESKSIIDWCPNCHGTWLDKEEFDEIVKHLRGKLNALKSGEMAKKVLEELKEIATGPEGKVSEILDVQASIAALINMTIFARPRVFNLLQAMRRLVP